MKTYHFQFDEPGIATVLKGLRELPYRESASMILSIQEAMDKPEALEAPVSATNRRPKKSKSTPAAE